MCWGKGTNRPYSYYYDYYDDDYFTNPMAEVRV